MTASHVGLSGVPKLAHPNHNHDLRKSGIFETYSSSTYSVHTPDIRVRLPDSKADFNLLLEPDRLTEPMSGIFAVFAKQHVVHMLCLFFDKPDMLNITNILHKDLAPIFFPNEEFHLDTYETSVSRRLGEVVLGGGVALYSPISGELILGGISLGRVPSSILKRCFAPLTTNLNFMKARNPDSAAPLPMDMEAIVWYQKHGFEFLDY